MRMVLSTVLIANSLLSKRYFTQVNRLCATHYRTPIVVKIVCCQVTIDNQRAVRIAVCPVNLETRGLFVVSVYDAIRHSVAGAIDVARIQASFTASHLRLGVAYFLYGEDEGRIVQLYLVYKIPGVKTFLAISGKRLTGGMYASW